MDSNFIVTLVLGGSVVISLVVALGLLVGRNITVREHTEYKVATTRRLDEIQDRQDARLVIREFQEWVLQFRHDIDRIEDAIRVLDQNKPTTGELDRAANALEARMVRIEEIVQHLITANGGKHA